MFAMGGQNGIPFNERVVRRRVDVDDAQPRSVFLTQPC